MLGRPQGLAEGSGGQNNMMWQQREEETEVLAPPPPSLSRSDVLNSEISSGTDWKGAPRCYCAASGLSMSEACEVLRLVLGALSEGTDEEEK